VPELPEVETVVRELRPDLVGRRLASVSASDRDLRWPWERDWNARLIGHEVKEIRRRGKWIILRLTDQRFLVFHLGMTGQLRVLAAREPVEDHTHLIFGLDDGTCQLRFRDIRRFGLARVFGDRPLLEQFFSRTGLGPEPFDLERDYWRSHLKKTGRCLKAVLLDQRVVAGVGNIYADESLWTARLHPARLGRETTPAEADRLRRAIAKVLNRAILKRGSTISDYFGGSGYKGGYQEEFRAYRKTGLPCRRCGAAIQCIRLAGRSTHFCPACQPPPRKKRRRTAVAPEQGALAP
jgi:formamidopyrimidine-DNA glycosylase